LLPWLQGRLLIRREQDAAMRGLAIGEVLHATLGGGVVEEDSSAAVPPPREWCSLVGSGTDAAAPRVGIHQSMNAQALAR
jgi:hypothetical protein